MKKEQIKFYQDIFDKSGKKIESLRNTIIEIEKTRHEALTAILELLEEEISDENN